MSESNLREKLRAYFEWQDGFERLPDECPLYTTRGFYHDESYEIIDGVEPITLGDLRRFVQEAN